ncbi:unnamed protein product [Ixodes hexagonus]
MASTMKIFVLAGALLLVLGLTGAQVADENGVRSNVVALGAGSGNGISLENMLWNYFMAKQMSRQAQLQRDGDITPELQRKRSGWKQCSFNAVSCFGRK